MMDVVWDYLASQGYADFVVREGLPGLVRRWEASVKWVVSGKSLDEESYRDDMDGRRILEEALNIARPEERAEWTRRVQTADDQIKAHLVPTKDCIWGEKVAAEYGYNRQRDWWYYHRPRNVGPDWQTF